jgi:hypothetical protein
MSWAATESHVNGPTESTGAAGMWEGLLTVDGILDSAATKEVAVRHNKRAIDWG